MEGHNFDIRKHLVEYDDVLNKHRDIIYKKRNEVLGKYALEMQAADNKPQEIAPDSSTPYTLTPLPSSLREMILKMVEEEVGHIVTFHTSEHSNWNTKEIGEVINTIFPFPSQDQQALEAALLPGTDKQGDVHIREQAIQFCMEKARAAYDEFERRIAEQVAHFDASLPPHVAVVRIEKDLLLRAVDSLWLEHLEAIDHLRAGIGLRGYGQRDPLVEYKREAYRLFTDLVAMITKQVVYSVYKIGIVAQQLNEQAAQPIDANFEYSAPAKTGDGSPSPEGSGAMGIQKVGRNDLCPCGSGKKFKKCHGA